MRKSLSLVLSAAVALCVTAGAVANQQAPKRLVSQDQPSMAKAGNQQLLKAPKLQSAPAKTVAKQSPFSFRNSEARKAAPKANFVSPANIAELEGLTGYDAFSTLDGFVPGLYSVESTDPEMIAEIVGGAGRYDDGEGKLYTVQFLNLGFFIIITNNVYDSETYEVIEQSNGELGMVSSDMAVNPVDDLPYGCFFTDDGSSFVWAVADYASWSRTEIAPCPEQLLGVGIDRQGHGYGIGASGMLYGIEVETGVFTEIGHTGLAPQYLSSAAVNTKTGELYFSCNPADETGWIYKIDTQTAAATPVVQFTNHDEIMNMEFPMVKCDEKAPAAAALEVVTDKGDLTATYKLTAPTTLFDGTEATGDITYNLTVNGDTYEEGTLAYGESVSGSYTAATPGLYKFEVKVTGADGLEGPSTSVNKYFGFGTPTAPAAATMAYDKDTRKVTLTWDAVTTTTNTGYIDPEAVRYSVYDYQGNLIGENLKKNTVNFTLPVVKNLTRYQYYVVAEFEGFTSEKTYTEALVLGEATPPYTVDFEDPYCVDYFTVIDKNGDGKTWTLNASGENHYMSVAYNSTQATDDYLVSVPVKVKAGEVYRFSMDAWCGATSYGPEAVEVVYGSAPTADALTKVLVPRTELNTLTPVELQGYLAPEEDGVVYVAVHGCSNPDVLRLNIDNFAIAAPFKATAPAGVTNLALIRDALGALKVTVRATAPAVDYAGNPVSKLTKAEIYRDGEKIATLTNVKAGEVFSYDDVTVPTTGTHTYSVVCANANGTGETVMGSVYVGFTTPDVVTDLSIVETTPGTVHVTWNAPATDVLGNPVPTEVLTYNVYDVQGQNLVLLYQNIVDTEFTKVAVTEGQDFIYYVVEPIINNDLVGKQSISDMIPVGEPYLAPWQFTFDDASFEAYIMGMNTTGGATWGIYDESTIGITGVEGDAFAGAKGQNIGNYGTLFTGKISLENLTNPVLSFYVYKVADTDANEMNVYVTCDGEEKEVLAFSQTENDVVSAWKKLKVRLTEYAGKNIQVTFKATTQTHVYSFLDAVAIEQGLEYDLAVENLTAPESVEPNKQFTVTATVVNEGANTADFSILFFRNGEQIEEYTGLTLAAGDTEVYELEQELNIMSDETNEYTAQVVYADDQNDENDLSQPVTVNLVTSSLKGVTDLEGVEENGGFKLTWTAPDPSTFTPDAVVEGFEGMEDNMAPLDPWTTIDVDGGEVGGIQGVNWSLQQTPQGFFVVDGVDGELAAATNMIAHSGNKFAASAFLYDGSNCDDWLVSPELYGGPQTISFYANSFQNQYPEQIEVLVSQGGKEVEDFYPVSAPIMVPGTTGNEVNYTHFTVALPDNSKYFAIRSFGTNAFYLMVDDVEYIPAGATSSLEIVGYNVYRDGVKLNEEPVTTTEYIDAESFEATVEYGVTVVFNRGESRISNIVTRESGIADMTVAGAKVAVEGHNIVVTGAKDMEVAIFTTDGKMISRNMGDTRVSVAPAVYVVKVGKKTTKVSVR